MGDDLTLLKSIKEEGFIEGFLSFAQATYGIGKVWGFALWLRINANCFAN